MEPREPLHIEQYGSIPTIAEQAEINRQNAQRREQFDRAEAARTEERQREAAQAELAEHLSRRGAAYLDATGEPEVPRSVLESWRDEYVSGKVAAREADRQRRLDATAGQGF